MDLPYGSATETMDFKKDSFLFLKGTYLYLNL